jgi:casein kinase 1
MFEAKLYKQLRSEFGLPTVYYYGSEGEHNILIMELLGHSLEDHLSKKRRPFTLKTTLMLGV